MEIENYEERRPEVVSVQNGWLRAFVGDDVPRISDALGLRGADGKEAMAAVRRHAGGRQVDAMLLNVPDWVEEHTEVFITGEPAHIAAPSTGVIKLDDLAFCAGSTDGTIPFELRSPSFAKLSGHRPRLEVGFSAIDRLAPMAGGGLNLVLDALANPKAFDALAAKAQGAGNYDQVLWLAGDDRAPDWATHALTTGRGSPISRSTR